MRIDEMPAGKEMDALLAEKVMGWGIEVNPIFEGGIGLQVSPGTTKAIAMFAPSTDIAAAWEVAGQLTKIQCGDDFYAFEITKKHYGWWVRVKHPLWMGIHNELGKNHEMYQAHADTAPLAICRCALKVAGVAEI